MLGVLGGSAPKPPGFIALWPNASGRCRAGDSRPPRPLHLPSASTRRGDDSARGLLPSIALSSGRDLLAYLVAACCARIFARSSRATSTLRSRSSWIAFCLPASRYYSLAYWTAEAVVLDFQSQWNPGRAEP